MRTPGAVDPAQVGWRLGDSHTPPGRIPLWVPFDRTAGVIGPQGSGKTLDLLVPALLTTPGPAIVTLTKPADMWLSVGPRQRLGPVAALDPFALAPGMPELVWDPIAGCTNPMVAERRARAFTAGTVKASIGAGQQDEAARFYANEAAKVIQGYLHAAALLGADLNDILQWVANPTAHPTAEETLRTHPRAAPFWDGLLAGAIHGDERTTANTITTVQQAMTLFFQPDIRRRCVPGPTRPATDLAELLRANGTLYLMGRDDPYASASPLMTAVTEDILDTALRLAHTNPYGRLCPPLLVILDELPSTTPLPTLATRMANERALGLAFIWASQTWRQLVMVFGEETARSLLTLSNNLVLFGGSKDASWNQEVSDLLGNDRVNRISTTKKILIDHVSVTAQDEPVMRPAELRRLPQRHALVIPENQPPVIARLHRCIDGPAGQQLLAEQAAVKARMSTTDDRDPVPLTKEPAHDHGYT